MDAMGQLLLMLGLGVLLVYLVMVAQFQSLRSPLIVMFTIPLAFTGGFLALLISGIELSVVSLIGFVMLVGVIVNNGIVLVDYINQLRLSGMERREAIVEAGVTRLAAHSHDVHDHHSGPCGHGLRRRRRYGSDAAGSAGVHRWPAVRHSHDAAGGAVYVRHPQPPGAAEGGGDGPADAGYLMGRGTFPEEFSLIELPFKLIVATAWVPILM